MGCYTVTAELDIARPLSELKGTPQKGWIDLKEAAGRYVTDGQLLVDRMHAGDRELIDSIVGDSSDPDSVEWIDPLLTTLSDEEQSPAQIRGYCKRGDIPALGAAKSRRIALVSEGKTKHHLACAYAVRLGRTLAEDASLKIGPSENLTWWSDGRPVVAVATFRFFDVELN